MSPSLSATYELSVVFSLIAMSVLAASLILTVRVALRWWRQPWPKLYIAHIANVTVQFLAPPALYHVVPLYLFNGFVRGTTLVFCLGLMLADCARLGLRQRETAHGPRWRPAILFSCLFILTLVAARMTADEERGYAALDDYRLVKAAFSGLSGSSPGRELLPVMKRTFPGDFEPVMDAYMARVRAANPQPEKRVDLPAFPIGPVARVLASHRADLARAPDAELANLARRMGQFAGYLAAIGDHCRGITGAGVRLDEAYASEASSPADSQFVAVIVGSQLVAARAGVDHPTPHPVDAARSARLKTLFNASYPGATTLMARPAGQCLAVAQYWQWISTLPSADAAYVIATSTATATKSPSDKSF